MLGHYLHRKKDLLFHRLLCEHYKKKYYDTETERDESGNLYIGLDTLFYMKKMIIGSETSVIEITDKQKGE